MLLGHLADTIKILYKLQASSSDAVLRRCCVVCVGESVEGVGASGSGSHLEAFKAVKHAANDKNNHVREAAGPVLVKLGMYRIWYIVF